MKLLTARQIRERTFTVRRSLFHEGYDLDDVDAFLDDVAVTLCLHEENIIHSAYVRLLLKRIRRLKNRVGLHQGECPSTVYDSAVPTSPVQQNAAHDSNGGR